jgi:NADH-quinone oxidoreductase subunit N
MRTYDLAPELIVVAAAVGLLLAPRLGGRLGGEWQQPWWRWAAIAAALLALGAELWLGATIGSLFGAAWQQDRFALFAKAALLLGLVVLVSVADWEAELTWDVVPLGFLAVFGGMVAASASSLVGLWAGLELAALAGVAAAGMAARATGLRLLVLSAVAGGLVAIGFAYLYAVAGGSSLPAVQQALASRPASLPVALAVLVLLGGLAVRVGLAPFHYATVEGSAGAPPAAAAVLGALTVGAAVVVAAKLLAALVGLNQAWGPWLAAVAAFTILVAGLRALVTGSLRGMAAWLVVGQAGWVVAALAGHNLRSTAAALFLLGALLVAGAGAPVLAQAVDEGAGPPGLARRDPLRAAGLAVVLLSLAGVPPLPGFFGQFAVAAELVRTGIGWLLGVGLLGSVVAAAAVVRPLHAFYLESGALETRRGPRVATTWTLAALVPAALLLAYIVFAYPVHDLAIQGATALGLR